MYHFGMKLRQLRQQTGKTHTQIYEELIRFYANKGLISHDMLVGLEMSATPPAQQMVEILADYYRVPVENLLQR